MAKKCLPGFICIENMTLFVLVLLIVLLVYVYHMQFIKQKPHDSTKIVVVSQPSLGNDPFNDPYSPPMKTNGFFFPGPPPIPAAAGIPINVQTRGTGMGYQQVGILTRMVGKGHHGDMILPLMGRKIMTGRDKWQYYTISNTGNLNTKLPVSRNGKSCTNEYGCDDISNGDTVYVEGYNDTFRATVYENNMFNYIPF